MKDVFVTRTVGDNPPTGRLLYGVDVREGLRMLAPESIHMIATSPPYWGLRDYGVKPSIWGGDPKCRHQWEPKKGDHCRACGAWQGQIGLESNLDSYVEHMVEVFREIRRVLRDDGTVWLNLGDTYNSDAGGSALKAKNLAGVPWRVALALQADGWWLRNAVVWHKLNPMPSPVQDRLNNTYELVFLLTKKAQYFFDLDAIRVPHTFGSYDMDGNFTPAQQWFSEDSTNQKMNHASGQLGVFAAPQRKSGRGHFNPIGKNPGDLLTAPETRHAQKQISGSVQNVTVSADLFSDTVSLVHFVLSQLEEVGSTTHSEAVAKARHDFIQNYLIQSNLIVFREHPYATVTVEQTDNEITIEFGRNRWVLQREGSSTSTSKPVRHRFIVEGSHTESLLILVNWMPGLPFPTEEINKLLAYRAKAYRDLTSPSTPLWDTPLSDADAKQIIKLQAPGSEVILAECMLAAVLHMARASFTRSNSDVPPVIDLTAHIGSSDVWAIATQPFSGAHFAVWPQSIPERCILSGTSEHGCCDRCGAPWRRVITRLDAQGNSLPDGGVKAKASQELREAGGLGRLDGGRRSVSGSTFHNNPRKRQNPNKRFDGWEPSCSCQKAGVTRSVVLDPFSGSGTTGQVALRLGRDYVGLDLNESYIAMAEARLRADPVPEQESAVPAGSVLDLFEVDT